MALLLHEDIFQEALRVLSAIILGVIELKAIFQRCQSRQGCVIEGNCYTCKVYSNEIIDLINLIDVVKNGHDLRHNCCPLGASPP